MMIALTAFESTNNSIIRVQSIIFISSYFEPNNTAFMVKLPRVPAILNEIKSIIFYKPKQKILINVIIICLL